jgi:hypothetical protein
MFSQQTSERGEIASENALLAIWERLAKVDPGNTARPPAGGALANRRAARGMRARMTTAAPGAIRARSGREPWSNLAKPGRGSFVSGALLLVQCVSGDTVLKFF